MISNCKRLREIIVDFASGLSLDAFFWLWEMGSGGLRRVVFEHGNLLKRNTPTITPASNNNNNGANNSSIATASLPALSSSTSTSLLLQPQTPISPTSPGSASSYFISPSPSLSLYTPRHNLSELRLVRTNLETCHLLQLSHLVPNLQRLLLSDPAHVTDEVVLDFVRSCKKLNVVSFSGCSRLTDGCLQDENNNSYGGEGSGLGGGLKGLVLGGVLEVLTLDYLTGLTDVGFSEFLKGLRGVEGDFESGSGCAGDGPNRDCGAGERKEKETRRRGFKSRLRCLSIYGCSQLSDFTLNALSETFAASTITTPTDISTTSSSSNSPSTTLMSLRPLQALNVGGLYNASLPAILSLIQSLGPHLKSLGLAGTASISSTFSSNSHGPNGSNGNFCLGGTEDILECVGTYCVRHLQELEMGKCLFVDRSVLERVLVKLKSLKVFYAEGLEDGGGNPTLLAGSGSRGGSPPTGSGGSRDSRGGSPAGRENADVEEDEVWDLGCVLRTKGRNCKIDSVGKLALSGFGNIH
jgi:hypothetical protein